MTNFGGLDFTNKNPDKKPGKLLITAFPAFHIWMYYCPTAISTNRRSAAATSARVAGACGSKRL